MTRAANHIVIPNTGIAYPDSISPVVKTDHILVMRNEHPTRKDPDGKRFGLAAIPRGASGRKVYKGDLVPGPWAFAFGLAMVIAANPEHGTYGDIKRSEAAGKEHDVFEGDTIEFDGVTYTVKFTDGFGGDHSIREFIKLVPVEN